MPKLHITHTEQASEPNSYAITVSVISPNGEITKSRLSADELQVLSCAAIPMNGAFTALYWWSPEFRVARRNEFGEKLLQQPGARLVRRVGHPRPKQISGNAYLQTGIERMYAVDLNSKLTRTEIKEGTTLLLKGDWFLSHDTAREIDLLLCETWDDAQLAMRTFDGVLSPFCQQVSAAVQ